MQRTPDMVQFLQGRECKLLMLVWNSVALSMCRLADLNRIPKARGALFVLSAWKSQLSPQRYRVSTYPFVRYSPRCGHDPNLEISAVRRMQKNFSPRLLTNMP
jgi:hypothetical protein